MAAAMGHDGYEAWLEKKLLAANSDADTDVLVTYIVGILEEEACSDEEKKESLVDLLGQVVEESADQENLCGELLNHWKEVHGNGNTSNQNNSTELTDHLAHILETQKIEAVKPKTKSKEDEARKAAILASYAAVSDGEDDDEPREATAAAPGPGGDLDFKNVNADLVKKTEVEQRERSKQESDRKKEKDKLDREAQKQKSKDRKEGEKKRTQKGERRR